MNFTLIMNFMMTTVPQFINQHMLDPIMTYVFGPSMSIILPQAVKEHFSSSPQRLLSFLFFMFILNGCFRLILSLSEAFFNIADFPSITDFFDWLKSILSFTGRFIYNAGYREGFYDGKNDNINKYEEIKNYEESQQSSPSFGYRIKAFLFSLMYLFVVVEILIAIFIAL